MSNKDLTEQIIRDKIEHETELLMHELSIAYQYKPVHKDILIVVHDQLDYLKECIRTIEENTTEGYTLHIWDNNSKQDTKDYIKTIKNAVIYSSEKNEGFIKPNNVMASKGTAPYIILINSDVIVYPDWDKALISWLQHNPNVAITGYSGAILDENFQGSFLKFGKDADYVCGWCLCLSRETYNEFGLFDDKNLEFAYCEDSDLSFRVREAGKEIYVLSVSLAYHFENKTIVEVHKEKEVDIGLTFEKNHNYIKSRWLDLIQRSK